MKIGWDDERMRKFVTPISLVSSKGEKGYDVMACAWTYFLSFEPALLAVSVAPRHLTAENIMKHGEFGVSLLSEEQSTAANVAGWYSGRDYDKLSALRELGYSFSEGEETGLPLLKEAVFVAECKLRESIEFGDHILFVGEVLSASSSKGSPLVSHGGGYYKIGQRLSKPPEEELERIEEIVEKHRW